MRRQVGREEGQARLGGRGGLVGRYRVEKPPQLVQFGLRQQCPGREPVRDGTQGEGQAGIAGDVIEGVGQGFGVVRLVAAGRDQLSDAVRR